MVLYMPSKNTDLIMEDQLDPCTMETNDTSRRIALQFSYVSEAYIQPTIFGIGILTNTLSLIVLKGVRMNKVFRMCLMSLAFSDLCNTIIGLTQILVEIISYCGEVPEGRFEVSVIINNALYMMFLLFVSISASLVVFIAFIRNIMYLKPLKARAYFTSRITKIFCGLIFLITFIMYTPTSLLVMWLACYKENNVSEEHFCYRINQSIPTLEKVANVYLYFVTGLYGPFMILVYIANFICIRVSLRRSAESIASMTSPTTDSTQHRRNDTVTKITKTLSLILILDVVCTLPSLLQSIGLVIDPEDKIFEKKQLHYLIVDPIAEILLALRPAYNFWLYVFQRPEFRKRLLQIIHKVMYPCCKYSCCICSGHFTKDKLQNQSIQMTSSLANDSKKNLSNVNMTRISPHLQSF